jgi:hypothetical protein
MMRWLGAIMIAIPMTSWAQPAPVAALPIVQQWTTFHDQQENAFTLEVPQNWQVQGGTLRRNALQFRNWVRVVSLDGNTTIAVNDPQEGSYVIPTQMLAMAGFREGSLYGGGGGTQYTVARYLNGSQFAASWGQRKLAAVCQNVRVERAEEQPQLTQAANTAAQAFGMSHDAGVASFSCTRNGVSMRAEVLASVVAISGQAGAIWYAEWMQGFVAPAPLAGVAAGVLMHMLETMQINPEWVLRTLQANLDVSHIAAETNHAISNTLMQSWGDRGAVMDRIMNEGSRTRLGIDIYRNPATGSEYTVSNTHNYYWVNPAGTVVGTNTDTAPNGFSRLSRVPP